MMMSVALTVTHKLSLIPLSLRENAFAIRLHDLLYENGLQWHDVFLALILSLFTTVGLWLIPTLLAWGLESIVSTIQLWTWWLPRLLLFEVGRILGVVVLPDIRSLNGSQQTSVLLLVGMVLLLALPMFVLSPIYPKTGEIL